MNIRIKIQNKTASGNRRGWLNLILAAIRNGKERIRDRLVLKITPCSAGNPGRGGVMRKYIVRRSDLPDEPTLASGVAGLYDDPAELVPMGYLMGVVQATPELLIIWVEAEEPTIL